jgi:hypothetical protein
MDDVTEVLGIRGRVHVRNLDERLGEGVYVTAQEATTVAPDEDPAPPSVLDELRFRERLDALEILGRQGLGNLASGATLRPAVRSRRPIGRRSPPRGSRRRSTICATPATSSASRWGWSRPRAAASAYRSERRNRTATPARQRMR